MRIAIIGDYDKNRPSHAATTECLQRASGYFSEQFTTEWMPTLSLEANHALAKLQNFNGIWGAPGDHDSQRGMINAIQFSRENNIPYLGT